ncbi:aminotransferase class V-fold PLP-dependent enzyme [Flavihumibacter profundi]|uniref:aminotransferase class V-fold PLP-dependent enzyme n=1 Tax=Flavihumibacter profundi TaxID=2716883 RepID=UPI001CC41206|nr:aminotransferase class V-fold PLP-dependent enzyme [Flavihumibacter profundi]MBZ5859319.1 aminotransferase class V-fold PLP-dependent enzyme [Flavihumibacter profundi]
MKRRNLMKGLGLLPLAGVMAPFKSVFAAPETGLAAEQNIFQSIGVEPIINCRGTFTIIGGSIERVEVRAAMEAASKNFVQYDEMADAIHKRLAEITGAEWALVSAGCAAGLKHVTAACVTGGNPEKLIRIPDLTGFDKTEVIIPSSSRNVYDHAIRNIGVRVITVDNLDEMEKAINSHTAMIYLMAFDEAQTGNEFTLANVSKIAKLKNIPVLIDAAAEVLTIPNVHLQRGADIVAYSGGKAICGPQCAGLIIGKKDILMSAWQASSPHHGPGRDNKVGREEMMGMLAAVEAWTKRDHAAEWKTWLSYLANISKKLTSIPGVTTSVFEPTELSNRSPVLNVFWDPAKFNITGAEMAEVLGRTKPRIAVGSNDKDGQSAIDITTGQMQPGNDTIVANRVYEVLLQKRTPKPAMQGASFNLTGRWDATIQFFSSTSRHSLFLEQDGNWLQGIHQGDFSTREIKGSLEGDAIKLKSVVRQPADFVTFIFTGKASADKITGDIYMGEYRTATFTAVRINKKPPHEQIMVPGGPPLAT